jgi:hypothetical protein
MKTILFAAAAIVFLSPTGSFAKPLAFPDEDNAQFTITIPDNWKPEIEDGVLEAITPDENVYLAIWELESEKDAEALGDDIDELLKDHAKDVKIVGEPQKASPGGMEGLLFSGTAKDKDDDSAIEFFALVFSPKKGSAAVIYIESAEGTSEVQAEKLKKILQSLKPGKGE